MKFSLIPKSVAILVAICAVLSVLIACVNSITAPIIEQNLLGAKNEALNRVLPDAENNFESPAANFEQLCSEGKIPTSVTNAHKAKNGAGYVVEIKTASGQFTELVIMCGISADYSVVKVELLQSNATLTEAKEYGKKLEGLSQEEVAQADTVSGATITTGAYKQAILDAINAVINLSGGQADLRTEEEILSDNLNGALGVEKCEFERVFITELGLEGFDAIYSEKSGKGYVFVKGETFIGIDAQGKALTQDAELAAQAEEGFAILSASTVETFDFSGFNGIPTTIIGVSKTATGNYVVEIRGEGYAIHGAGKEHEYLSGVPIMIRVSMTPDGKIIDCLTVSHGESKGYGDKCGSEEYYGQYDKKTKDEIGSIVISGATATTNGYRKAILNAFEAVSIMEGGVTNEEQK